MYPKQPSLPQVMQFVQQRFRQRTLSLLGEEATQASAYAAEYALQARKYPSGRRGRGRCGGRRGPSAIADSGASAHGLGGGVEPVAGPDVECVSGGIESADVEVVSGSVEAVAATVIEAVPPTSAAAAAFVGQRAGVHSSAEARGSVPTRVEAPSSSYATEGMKGDLGATSTSYWRMETLQCLRTFGYDSCDGLHKLLTTTEGDLAKARLYTYTACSYMKDEYWGTVIIAIVTARVVGSVVGTQGDGTALLGDEAARRRGGGRQYARALRACLASAKHCASDLGKAAPIDLRREALVGGSTCGCALCAVVLARRKQEARRLGHARIIDSAITCVTTPRTGPYGWAGDEHSAGSNRNFCVQGHRRWLTDHSLEPRKHSYPQIHE
ncbi:hypothetical protein B0H15DRAFT_804432 [Mycena belliarum]|uniref:Uncharacterized protein n=1 Tax=Mycena belliarum TaxID=1033014 RepID=A0AAD6TYE0_9AGAR|nr:hypothetical protein B0H15DRAFT_804432 [Mycena belliae]